MIDRLPLTVGFARVSQATEDQGSLETQTQQIEGYRVHELAPEFGLGLRSDCRALRDLQDRLQAAGTLLVTVTGRISRRVVDAPCFIEEMTDAGIHLVVLTRVAGRWVSQWQSKRSPILQRSSKSRE